MNLFNAFDKLLENKLVYNSYETYRFYESHINNIKMVCENIDLINIDENYIKTFILNQKLKKLSNATINKRLLCFKMVLSENKLDCSYICKLKEIQKTFDFLSYSQVLRLLEYLHISNIKIENKLVFRLLLDTGIRLNELLNIKLEDIELESNCIYLRTTKTSRERIVFFTDDTKLLLQEHILIEMLNDYDYIIDLKKSSIESLFNRVNKHLKFRKFSPHMLRHTYATILVNENTNLEFIRCTLGHSNLTTTKRYLHQNQENLYKIYKEKFKI